MTPTKFLNTFLLAVCIVLLIDAFITVSYVRGQVGFVVPFPTGPVDHIPGHPTNLVSVMQGSPLRVGQAFYVSNAAGGQCEWGPCAANVLTKQTWQDVIWCPNCSSGYRYASLGPCDNHGGVSKVFATQGFIMADNLGANAPTCGKNNNGPLIQVYDARAWPPQFVFGFNSNLQALWGFKGNVVYFSGSPCSSMDLETQTFVANTTCPPSPDPFKTTDSLGQTWTLNGNPNGLRVASGPTTPTPSRTVTATSTSVASPTATSTPQFTASRTPTGTITPTPACTPIPPGQIHLEVDGTIYQCFQVTLTPSKP